MSKFMLGQRQFPTLGLRSQQPKNYVGPTLSCYLGCSTVCRCVQPESQTVTIRRSVNSCEHV